MARRGRGRAVAGSRLYSPLRILTSHDSWTSILLRVLGYQLHIRRDVQHYLNGIFYNLTTFVSVTESSGEGGTEYYVDGVGKYSWEWE